MTSIITIARWTREEVDLQFENQEFILRHHRPDLLPILYFRGQRRDRKAVVIGRLIALERLSEDIGVPIAQLTEEEKPCPRCEGTPPKELNFATGECILCT